MIICHVGPPWALFRGPRGPKMAQNSTKMAQNITKIALHGPKCQTYQKLLLLTFVGSFETIHLSGEEKKQEREEEESDQHASSNWTLRITAHQITTITIQLISLYANIDWEREEEESDPNHASSNWT